VAARPPDPARPPAVPPLLTLEVRGEHDVVVARQRARQVAGLLGFGVQEQTWIATAVSEIARNTVQYGGGGRCTLRVDAGAPRPMLLAELADEGPGIRDLDTVLEGRYHSPSGMGAGIVGARRIMDRFEIRSAPGAGTTVVLGRALPADSPGLDPAALGRLTAELARQRPRSVHEELQRQNQELLGALAELRSRQEQLEQLSRELEDTNRGVVALYAELDERVEQLRRSNAMRRQFTSYLSHEFRTPLNSMLSLSGLLLDRVDGELAEEQEKQVFFIQRSARDLLEMVDDLLDTARVEAGQVSVRPARFSVGELFNALRATLRPLLTRERVELAFEDPHDLPPLHTDEAKLSQILRNFISNALKFTEQGEIRVRVEPADQGRAVRFAVSDTGIGIAPEDQVRIFEDFAQVDGAMQRKLRGTGLGLALSRKLARVLGGEVGVESTPGVGSTFFVVLPREPAASGEGSGDPPPESDT
jgi:signal transduction histidine kinase